MKDAPHVRTRLIAGLTAAVSALALTVTTVPSAHASTPLAAPAVIGGSDISISDSPWQVLFIMNESTVCSGSFVSPTQIVSAAHCFVGIPTSSIKAWAGITKLTERSAASALPIRKITTHPGFSFDTYANDIAVVTLSKAPSPSLNTRTIALPVNEDAATWPAAGTSAVVSGWGETAANNPRASTNLKAARVDILASPSSAICGEYGASYIPSMQICAGGGGGTIDACQGDSGGPLVAREGERAVLAGIASTGQSCAQAAYPGLYARTTTFIPWLAEQGVDVNAAGTNSAAAAPGTDNDGEPASFSIGGLYTATDFASFTRLPKGKASVSVLGGKACAKSGAKVSITGVGKCSLKVTVGKKSSRVVVTIY